MTTADMARRDRLTGLQPTPPTQPVAQPPADVKPGAHEDVAGSSTIAATGHDPATGTLYVRFHTGATYTHSGVNTQDYTALRAAKSIGQHYARHHRGVNHRRVG